MTEKICKSIKINTIENLKKFYPEVFEDGLNDLQ